MTDRERDAIERLLDGEIAGPGGSLAPPGFEPAGGDRGAWIEAALDRAQEAGPSVAVAKPGGRRALPWIGLVAGIAAAAALVIAFFPGGEPQKPPQREMQSRPAVQEPIAVTAPVAAQRAPDAEHEPDASPTGVEIARTVPTEPHTGRSVSGSAPPRSGEMGYLTVATKPWSVVYVDGERVRMTPIVRHALRAGRHTIVLRRDDLHIKRTFRIQIKNGYTTTIVKRLDEPDGAVSAQVSTTPAGALSVTTKPWTDIYVDGELVGRTPLVKHKLRPGTYRVELRNKERGIEKIFGVKIQADHTTQLVRDFEKE